MLLTNVAIAGLAHIEPPERMMSDEFERRLAPTMERLGLPPAMLQNVAGISERRWGGEKTQPSDIAAAAAEKVLAETGIPRD